MLTSKRLGSVLGVTVAATWIGTMALAPAALAQQAQSTGPVPFRLFATPDSVDLNDGAAGRLAEAARKAQGTGECPFARIRIETPKGDDLYQASIARARRQVVLEALNNRGIDVSRFVVDSIVSGSRVVPFDTYLDYDGVRDREKPKLDTNSALRKGSRVKAGDKIKVTMVARDDANLWQSGIKTIQLVADSESGRFIASQNYLPSPGCHALPMERRVEATYTVPSNPPPIVRLAALAEDFAGLMDTDVGEFPTQGDWYGRIEWSVHGKEDTSRRPNENRAETKYDGHADLTVTYDGQGNLTGTLVGSQKVDTLWWGFPHGSGEVCKGSAPPTPVRARVVGSYTPGRAALSLQLVDVEAAIRVQWSGGGPSLICTPPLPIENGPTLSALVRSLQPAGDGAYRAEFTPTDPIHTFRYSLTLRPTVK